MSVKEELSELNKSNYIIPTIIDKIEHTKDESLVLFNWTSRKGKRYRLFYGIGIVYRVVKGDKQDLVYINFGIFKEHSRRLVVVYQNHARRQLLTLKRGQVCQVYGLCRYYEHKAIIKGKEKKGQMLGLYAYGILGWYVPTMLDIKKLPINEDLVAPSEKEKKVMDDFDRVLNEFIKGE